MGYVNVQLVREFFELNLFQVLTNWHPASRRVRPGEHGGQLSAESTDCGARFLFDLERAADEGDETHV